MRPVLFVGDIHLGRTAIELPVKGPEEAWRRTVETAIQQRAQAVVLAGDVVDQDRDRFEALAHLDRGVRHLETAGIRVIAVSGNHDSLVLPLLADRTNVHLLGAGGTWERLELDGLALVGWSFPTRHVRQSPLAFDGLGAALQGGGRVIGILHADLDAQGSPYAPVRRDELLAVSEVEKWVLGHIHKPSDLRTERVGYLGSLVGLHRNEVGTHGPWRFDGDWEQLALGPAHWMQLDVTARGDDVRDADRAHETLERAVRSAVANVPDAVDAVGLSVRFVGEVSHVAGLRALAALSPEERIFHAEIPLHVLKVEDHTRPTLDLEQLRQEASPVGRLAGALLEMDRGNVPQAWLDSLPTDEPASREALATAGWTLLRDLLAQREVA